MDNNEEDEEELWTKPFPKKIVSSGTYTSTATSGASVSNVFGDDSELKEIIDKRDKKVKTCKSCDIDFSDKFFRCPICNKKLEDK